MFYILARYLEEGATLASAQARAEKAALRYAGKQHRFRAETIVHTERSYAYNRGADMGVRAAIRQGLMGRCEMVWTTAGTNRVCPRCLALKDTVVGHTDEGGVQIPPLHPRCRCTIAYQEVAEPRINQPARPLTSPRANGNVVEEIKLPKNFESKNFDELKEFIGKVDDTTVRKWYDYHDKRIHEQIDPGLSIEEKARCAFKLRNEYRTQARELMANKVKRRELDITDPNKT